MTHEEAIKIMEQRECCMECVVEDFTCKDCDTAFDMAIKSLEQIEKIKSIINGPVYMQGYVPKYMDICEVLKEAEHDQRRSKRISNNHIL